MTTTCVPPLYSSTSLCMKSRMTMALEVIPTSYCLALLYFLSPFRKPTSGNPVAEGGNVYRRRTGAMAHPIQGVRSPADGSHPPVRGFAGGDCQFITPGSHIEKTRLAIRIKCRDSVVWRHQFSFA
jgi:hypothetical protein